MSCCPFFLGEEKQAAASAGPLPSVFASVGLNLSDFEMSSHTSELLGKLHKLLTGTRNAGQRHSGRTCGHRSGRSAYLLVAKAASHSLS